MPRWLCISSLSDLLAPNLVSVLIPLSKLYPSFPSPSISKKLLLSPPLPYSPFSDWNTCIFNWESSTLLCYNRFDSLMPLSSLLRVFDSLTAASSISSLVLIGLSHIILSVPSPNEANIDEFKSLSLLLWMSCMFSSFNILMLFSSFLKSSSSCRYLSN